MSKTLFSYSECYSDTVEFWGRGGEDAITRSLHNKSEFKEGGLVVWEKGESMFGKQG